MPACEFLASQSQLVDQAAVAIVVFATQILKEPAPLAYHHQKSTSAVEVFAVGAEVLCELVNSFGQNGDLNFR